jgi:hypothetical protein
MALLVNAVSDSEPTILVSVMVDPDQFLISGTMSTRAITVTSTSLDFAVRSRRHSASTQLRTAKSGASMNR